MVTRTLLYFHLASYGFIWRGSQLLICLNAALDPLLYGYFIGGNLKSVLQRLLRCSYLQQRRPNVTTLTVPRTNTLTSEQGNITYEKKQTERQRLLSNRALFRDDLKSAADSSKDFLSCQSLPKAK